MPDEETNSGTEPAPEDESSARDTESKEDEVDSSRYEAVVREYGDAVRQMRELHSRVDGLAQQLQENVAESDDSVSTSDGDGRPNTARIRKLESRLEESPPDGGLAANSQHTDEPVPADFLARMEALESRMGERLGGTDSHAGPVHETSKFTEFQARIDALERWSLLERIGELEGRTHGPPAAESALDKTDSSSPAAAGEQTHILDRGNEISELKFQIANLAAQLSKSEAQLKQVHEARRHRRVRSSDPHPGWKFWRKKRSP